MTTPDTLRRQQVLLQQLAQQNDPQSRQLGAQLQQLHHDQQLALLGTDVYLSATLPALPEDQRAPPPHGWLRASEHLDQFRALSPHLAGMSNDDLLYHLQPDDSKFRAEIYLPDPTVLGPGYKPVMSYKGSAGEVAMPVNGVPTLVDSSTEDFLGNNFPQSMGLRTDYYDRAMELADFLKKVDIDFEITGHSLGGGMCSAGAAVSGATCTSFNAAGLHDNTAADFARRNPGVEVYPVDPIVRSYVVAGELLNANVQETLRTLDEVKREHLGTVMKEGSELLKDNPTGQQALTQLLEAQVTPASAPAVREFVRMLAEGEPDRLMQQIPLAAGQRQPLLEAMAYGADGHIVKRMEQASAAELMTLAEPLLRVVSTAARGAHAGHLAGEVPRRIGENAEQTLGVLGDANHVGAALAGAAADHSIRANASLLGVPALAQAESRAHLREAGAWVEAGVDRVQGGLQKGTAEVGGTLLHGVSTILPEAAARELHAQADGIQQRGQQAWQRNQHEAAAARESGVQDAAEMRQAGRQTADFFNAVGQRTGEGVQRHLTEVGENIDRRLDGTGAAISNLTEQAPAVGAAVGAGIAAPVQAAMEVTDYTMVARTLALTELAGPAGKEMADRHSMKAAVQPSMQHRIDQTEVQAQQHLYHLRMQAPAPSAPVQSDAQAREPARAMPVNDMFQRVHAALANPDEFLSRQQLHAVINEYRASPEGQQFQQQVQAYGQMRDEQERQQQALERQQALEEQQRQMAEQAEFQQSQRRGRSM